MLSVSKLNTNRARINQHNTSRGILKDKRDEIIEAVALTLAPKEYTGEEKTIDEQLSIMKREKDEKKLLEYQLKNNPQNVSTFLANKYADGNFNLAVKDRYDNSEERKKSGLTFDYHVYLPMDERYNGKRGHNKYALSDTILDRSSGDSYTYHLPIWINSEGEIPFFVTDYGEEVDNSNSRGLKWALQQLRIAIDSGRFFLDPLSEEILSQFGFLVAGKIIHDIKGDILVEKYLKSIHPPEKKAEAVRYLDFFVKDNSTPEVEKKPEAEQAPTEDVVDDTFEEIRTALGKGASEVKSFEQLRTLFNKEGPSLEELRMDLENKGVSATSLDRLVAEFKDEEDAPIDVGDGKTVPIKPGEYKNKSVADVAKENSIPVVEYLQTKKSNNPESVRWLEIFTGDTVFKLGFRTGYRGGPLDSFNTIMRNYHKEVLSDVMNGKLTVGSVNKYLQELLEKKGFDALVTGDKPPVIVDNFSRAKTL